MKSTALASGLALLLTAGQALAEDAFTLSAGVHHSRGDYGTDRDTEITTVPVTASYDTDRWRFRASLPWTRVSGDPNVLPGTGPVLNLNPLGRGRIGLPLDPEEGDVGRTGGSASGVGDLGLRVGYALAASGPVRAELSATAKVATADEDKGLGTGANDYGVALDLAGELGATTVFGGVNYTRLGNSDFIDARDVLGFNVGAGWQAGPGQLGLAYDFRESAATGFDDRREVTGYYQLDTRRGNPFQVYVSAGIGDGSPNWGSGVSYGWTF
ncbi:transporter [Arenimonas sp.]|uniref:transporter n=1 Tax=Arenimonas sp. TaxID=1872635 RepID=UPI0025C6BF63|nr:transporter [Arenimonas sp.]